MRRQFRNQETMNRLLPGRSIERLLRDIAHQIFIPSETPNQTMVQPPPPPALLCHGLGSGCDVANGSSFF
jgi:hypothetical protein